MARTKLWLVFAVLLTEGRILGRDKVQGGTGVVLHSILYLLIGFISLCVIERDLLKLQEALGGFVKTPDKIWYWLGLNDIETEGTFVWDHSGTEASSSFNNWSGRQPDNGRNIEDCAHLVRVP